MLGDFLYQSENVLNIIIKESKNIKNLNLVSKNFHNIININMTNIKNNYQYKLNNYQYKFKSENDNLPIGVNIYYLNLLTFVIYQDVYLTP